MNKYRPSLEYTTEIQFTVLNLTPISDVSNARETTSKLPRVQTGDVCQQIDPSKRKF